MSNSMRIERIYTTGKGRKDSHIPLVQCHSFSFHDQRDMIHVIKGNFCNKSCFYKDKKKKKKV